MRADEDGVLLVLLARDAIDEKVTAPISVPTTTSPVAVGHYHRDSAEGDLTIHLDRCIVCEASEELHLTRKEHDVLYPRVE